MEREHSYTFIDRMQYNLNPQYATGGFGCIPLEISTQIFSHFVTEPDRNTHFCNFNLVNKIWLNHSTLAQVRNVKLKRAKCLPGFLVMLRNRQMTRHVKHLDLDLQGQPITFQKYMAVYTLSLECSELLKYVYKGSVLYFNLWIDSLEYQPYRFLQHLQLPKLNLTNFSAFSAFAPV